jgi:hypothetical protein
MMMNCDMATELLPWLLNGSLEAGERLQMLEHVRSCGSCRAALADTRAAWEIFDWHPPAAALVAHAGGGAAAGEPGDSGSSDVEEHLASCPRCAAELELVRTSRLLVDPAEDGRIALLAPRREEAASSGEAASLAPAAPARRSRLPIGRHEAAARRAWRRSALAASLVGLLAATGWIESARQAHDLERRLAAAPRSSAAPRLPVTPAPTGEPANNAPRSPAAASPAPAMAARPGPSEAGDLQRRAGEAEARLAALARQNQQLQQQVSELGRTAAALSQRSDALRGPQPPAAPDIESDVLVSELAPVEQRERAAGAPAAAAVPLSSGAATLLLHTRHRGSYPSYELEVRDAQGRLVGTPTRVLRLPGGQDSFEEFDITLRRGALPPGAYTLHLYGRTESAREALETYSLRVS